ncbi:hypothetical protein CR513_05827, partial [Mucuna pruriens]
MVLEQYHLFLDPIYSIAKDPKICTTSKFISPMQTALLHQRAYIEAEQRVQDELWWQKMFEKFGVRNKPRNSTSGSTQLEWSRGKRLSQKVDRQERRWKNLKIPIFNREDTSGWVGKMEQYFHLKGVLDDEKLVVTMVALERKALMWL